MHRLPQRTTLVSQIVTILKEQIGAGHWVGHLPGEHALCEQLRVSRVTLRNALGQLQREGWVQARQGRPRAVVRKMPPASPANNPSVVLLTPEPLHSLHPFAIFWMDSLREHLAEAGYHLEIHASREVFGVRATHALQSLADRLRPSGWVLYHSTHPMQKWFSERAFPCVITGSRHENVRLPSFDMDYRATCRHAAGQFLARGHQHLMLVNPDSGAAGELESEQGFQEAVKATPSMRVRATVLRHDGTVGGICGKLQSLLRTPGAPTAFLVSRPGHVLTVMGYLLQAGRRLPQDAALI